MEYDWRADSTYARASLADRPLRKVLGRALRLPVPAGVQAHVLNTAGTARHWEVSWEVNGDAAPADILRLLGESLVAAQWRDEAASLPTQRRWTFREADGSAGTGVAEAVSSAPQVVTVHVRIERGS